LFSGVSTVGASSNTKSPMDESIQERSLDNIIDDISKKVEISDESIKYDKEEVLKQIEQKDVDNLNKLAKSLNLKCKEPYFSHFEKSTYYFANFMRETVPKFPIRLS
jgi:hypothetical protein